VKDKKEAAGSHPTARFEGSVRFEQLSPPRMRWGRMPWGLTWGLRW
jgi:hypothetical protein